jgi:hypothetical protein
LIYPDGNGAADGPDAVKDLADSVGPYTNMRFANAAARDAVLTAPVEGQQCWLQDINQWSYYDGSAWAPMTPFRIATVSLVLAGTGVTVSSAFTWPTSRFTQAPIAVASSNGGTGSSAFAVALTAPPTASGGTAIAISTDGASHVLTAMNVHIIGIQMLSSAGAG